MPEIDDQINNLPREIREEFSTMEENEQFLYDLLKEVEAKLQARPYMGEFVMGKALRERIAQAVAHEPGQRIPKE